MIHQFPESNLCIFAERIIKAEDTVYERQLSQVNKADRSLHYIKFEMEHLLNWFSDD